MAKSATRGRPSRSEGSLKLLFEYAPDTIYLHDLKGVIVDGNKKAEELTGYSRDELIGKSLLETGLLPEDQTSKVVESIRMHAAGKEVPPREYVIRRKDGRLVDVEITTYLISLGGNKYVMGVVRDITRRKNIEEALMRERDIAKSYLEVAADLVVAIDNGQRVTLINDRGCELLGCKRADVLGKNWFDGFVPEKARAGVKAAFSRLMGGGGKAVERYENPVVTCTGEEKLIEWRNTLLRDEEGHIIGTLSSGRDITDRRRTRIELENAYAMTRNILDKAPFGIYVTNKDGGIDYVNPKMLAISGYNKKDFMAFNVYKLPGYVRTGISDHIRWVLGGKSFFIGPVDYVSMRGKKTIRNFMGMPLEERGEKKALVFVEDVTKRREAEMVMERAYEELKTLDAIKDDFVNATSHALKTPLTSITSFVGLLQKEKLGPLNDRQRHGLDIVRSECMRLQRLIDHILDSSRIDAGEFAIRKAKTDLAGLAANTIESVANARTNNEDQLFFHAKGPVYAKADPFWVEKVMDNLISNAVKFTQKGRIDITIEKTKGGVKFSVKDTGRGVSEEQIPKLFDKFYQAEKQTATGTGLGLYISKKLVEAHGGKIGCESDGPGKGATFWFTLPG